MRKMGDLKIRGELVEEQLWPKKSTLIKPIPRRAQSNVPIGAGSSFQPWPKPCKLATVPENDNLLTEENAANGSGVTFGAANDHNTAYETLPNIDQETEKRNKRIVSNRYSARRSRLKKLAYMEDLENIVKSYKEKIAFLNRQIQGQQDEQRFLRIERHSLIFHMAASEKHRILQQVEIEKNRAEADRLREVERKLAGEAQASRMLNLTCLQLTTNSNLNPLDRRN